MKQQMYLLLSLTLHVGLSSCYGHGVKGSFSKSFSSSSASASSSAFSGSFSSGADGEDLNNAGKSGSGAYSTAFANAGLNGAPAQAVSGSGSFANSNSGSYSGSLSGSNADVGGGKTTAHFHNGGAGLNGQIPVVVSGAGSFSGANSGFLTPTVGGNPQGSKCAGNTACGYNKQGTYSGQQGANAVPGTQGQDVNINDVTKENGAYVNDFNIPDEFILENKPKHHFPGPDGSIHASKPAQGGVPVVTYEPQFPQIPTYSYVGPSDGSYRPGECKSCKGPFPGPKGSIHDSKPVPHNEGIAPSWTSEQAQPPLVRPTIDYSQLPGPSGSIYDSKPVTYSGNIPVAVIPSSSPFNPVPSVSKGPQVQPDYDEEKQLIRPGTIALKFIGKLPGPMGSIYSSFPVGKVGPNVQHVPVLIPVSISAGKPGCAHGQCDEYGGRLSCHGVDCFGPGKKPDNVHFSNANSQANSNANQGHANVNYNFEHPTLRPDETNCLNGQCNIGSVKKPGNVHFSNANSQANSNTNQEHADVNYNFENPSSRPEETDCSKGQCNIDGAYYPQKSVPGLPGKTCSGLACLDHVNTQVNIPVAIVPHPVPQPVPQPLPQPAPQPAPHYNDEEHPKFDFDIDLRQKPDDHFDFPSLSNHMHKHTISGSANSNTNSQHEEKINVHIGQKPSHIPIDIPVEAETPTTAKPGSGSRDFLLPGNKPYHHHHVVRPHHPNPENHPTPTHQPPQTPDSNYYKCTADSCKLPKPSNNPHTEDLDLTIKCEGGNCERKYYSCTGSSCPLPHSLPNPSQPGKTPVHNVPLPHPLPNPFQPGKAPFQQGPERPVQPVIGVSACNGQSCRLPKPSGIPHQHVQVNPGCQGNQCNVGNDNKFINYPPYPVNPSQEHRPLNTVGQFSGSNSAAKADGISYEEQASISDLPLDYSSDVSYNKNQGATKSKTGCTQGNCQIIPGSYSPGFVSGNVVVQKGNQQEIPVVDVLIPAAPCQGGKCSYPGSTLSSNQPCGNGNCGHGVNVAQYGGHSGAASGSFSGSTSHGGVNGCKNGACGLIPAGGGSGAYSGSSAFSGSSSGSFAANSNGPETGLKAIKDLINGLGQGVPGFNGASSFSHSGSSSYGSGFAGSYSSAGSSSY